MTGKTWIDSHLAKDRAYKETLDLDQEAMTRLLDADLARRSSRAFRQLSHAVEQAVQALDTQKHYFLSPVFEPDTFMPQPSVGSTPSKRKKNRN